MSEVYERLQDTAKDLIDRFGRSVTLVEKTRTLDATSPWDSTLALESETDYVINAVFMDSGSEDFEARLSAVSRLVLSPVEVNQTKVLVAAKDLGVVPTIEMELEDGTDRLAIQKVMVSKPGDIALLYVLVVGN